MFNDFAVMCTWEGDNTVMAQQTARYLVKSLRSVIREKQKKAFDFCFIFFLVQMFFSFSFFFFFSFLLSFFWSQLLSGKPKKLGPSVQYLANLPQLLGSTAPLQAKADLLDPQKQREIYNYLSAKWLVDTATHLQNRIKNEGVPERIAWNDSSKY
jgi:hypothetical protein